MNKAIQKEIIGDCILYRGDALEIMQDTPKADLCVSDVPYKLTAGGNSNHPNSMKGHFSAENYNNDGHFVICDITFEDMATPIYRALKDDADAYIMINDKNVIPAGNAFLDVGFKKHNLLTWEKGTVTPNKWYMKNQEYILYLWKGKARTINNPSSKQSVRLAQKDETNHPTEKPVLLMQHYIENSSQLGDLVLDPFMGVGTTGVAAIKSGRKFIGMEIDQQWFDLACSRIEQFYKTESQTDFFKASPSLQEAIA